MASYSCARACVCVYVRPCARVSVCVRARARARACARVLCTRVYKSTNSNLRCQQHVMCTVYDNKRRLMLCNRSCTAECHQLVTRVCVRRVCVRRVCVRRVCVRRGCVRRVCVCPSCGSVGRSHVRVADVACQVVLRVVAGFPERVVV